MYRSWQRGPAFAKVVAWTYPDGSVLCTRHGEDDEEAHPIFAHEEDALDLVCDECLQPVLEADNDY